MNVKINLSTPPDQMWETMQDERKRARRWFNKKAGGDRGLEELKRKARNHRGNYNHEEFSCEWCSSDGNDVMNRWLCVNNAIYSKTDVMLHARADILYYETNGSIGCFLTTPEDTSIEVYRDGEKVLLSKVVCIFTSHFFLRYCDSERKLGEKHEDYIQILKDFTLRNYQLMSPLTVNIYHDDDGQQNVDIALGGCVGRGKVIESDGVTVCEIDTCLSYEMLHKNQYRQCKDILDAWESNFLEIQNNTYDNPDVPVPVNTSFGHRSGYEELFTKKTRAQIKQNAKDYGNSYELQVAVDCYSAVLCNVLLSMCPKMDFMQLEPACEEIFSEAKKLYMLWDYLRNNIFCADREVARKYFDQMSEALHTIAKASDATIVFELRDVLLSTDLLDIRPETYEEICRRCGVDTINNNRINNNVMNDNQINELKTILKKNKVNLNTLLKGFYKGETDSYLRKVETPFVLSRLVPYVNIENDRKKLITAEKLWMEKVIDNDWSSVFTPYVTKYGKELTTLALNRLIDTDKYPSPKGNAQLDSKGFDTSVFDIIDEAAAYLCDEEDMTPQPVGVPSEEAKGTVTNEDPSPNTQSTPLVEFVVDPSDELHVSIDEARQEMTKVGYSLSRILTFINNVNPDTDSANANAAHLLVDNERLLKQYNEKKAELDKVKAERDDNQRKLNEANDRCNSLEQDKKKVDKELSAAKKTIREQADALKTANNNYNELVIAMKSNVQKIPLSLLRERCQFIGKSSVKDLTAFLEEYNIQLCDEK